MTTWKKFATFLAAIALVSTLGIFAAPARGASVEPIDVEGNPKCTDLGFRYGLKFDYPQSSPGTYPIGTGTVTWSTDGTYVDWSSTFGIDAVLVKGGPNLNLYQYDPPAESFGDTGLHSPINPNTGRPYELSHVDFCYDYEVTVTKKATPTYTRTWTWTIDKTGDQTELTLSLGQQFQVNYELVVDATSTDSDWAVSGQITITNPDPNYPALLTGVSDMVDGIAATVVCPVTFPYSLPAGETLVCSYSAALPDGSSRTNRATVTVAPSSPVGGGSGTAPVIFGDPTTEIDECVNVSDDQYGDLGRVCANEAPKTFRYSLWVGPYYECGDYEFVNVASFVTNDTRTTGSDSWTVIVHVPCPEGCTLTVGYWKTHSEFGPAPYDDTWAMLPNGASTPFFLSGQSWYQVLWTPPAGGNAYYILAHQYIGARLNILNGAASTPAVDAALAWATNFFNTYTPTSKLSKTVRDRAISTANLLDQYNNGYIGPGHCSE